jgi:uncharacterized protein
MESIYVPHIAKAPEQTWKIVIQDYLADLETLTPVQGTLQARHGGNFLEVKAKAEAIITLTCDRCLQQYNHRVIVNTSEIIWLQEPEVLDEPMLEREVALDDLVESLSPQGHFQPEAWLYEQFCLSLPQRQLCDRQCQGIAFENPDVPAQPIDNRWASLQSFKDQLR